MKIAGVFVVLAILFAAAQFQIVQVAIASDGVVFVEINVNVDEGLNAIELPIEPIPESIIVSLNNAALTPMYEEGVLYIFSPSSDAVKITYLANISVVNNLFSFDVKGGGLVKLTLSPEIILLSVPDNVMNFEYVNNGLVVEFYGPQKIEYVVRKEITQTVGQSSTTGTTTSAMYTETMTTTSTSIKTSISITPSTILPETGKMFWDQGGILMGGLAVAVAVGVSITLLRRHSRIRSLESGLSNIDLEILRLIRGSGGLMMQGDLQALLRLPKTTLWRHVRRLEKLGYIEIIKEGPFNKLMLIRDFE